MDQSDKPRFPAWSLELPGWVESALPPPEHVYETADDRMRLAVRLAELNVARGTGGPFGAAVFNLETGTLIAPGVNAVVPCHCSAAHAEIVAISLAQRILETHDLGGPGMPPVELATSTEPCAMCLGALPWSGIRSLVCGARDEDARALGFDEGPKPGDWTAALEERGIRVQRDVLREDAAHVLRTYVESGGPVYNGRSDE